MSQKSNIDIYSEEVHEIMGAPPAWIIRWGITIILIVILIVISAESVLSVRPATVYNIPEPDVILSSVS